MQITKLPKNRCISGGNGNMSLFNKIMNREEKLALVGLGYVGMPIAVAFAKKVEVIGFDVNAAKIVLVCSTSVILTSQAI